MSYDHYVPGNACHIFGTYSAKDKAINADRYVRYMLDRLQAMFVYTGLPETIPQQVLETQLLTNGNVFITSVNDTLYSFVGAPGGVPDVYYRPTKYIIANPGLNFNKECEIGVDGVLIKSDTMYMGVLDILNKYCSQIAETDLSLRMANINMRIIDLISAGDEKTQRSAMAYLKHIEDGDLGIVAETAFLDGVRVQPIAAHATNSITQLIELRTYLEGSMFKEIGLNAATNVKREALNSSETAVNDDVLMPLIENMLECRKEGIEQVNNMYGTNITVELTNVWKATQEEITGDNTDVQEVTENVETE